MKRRLCILSILLVIGYSCNRKNNDPKEVGMTLRMELFASNMEKSVNFYTEVLGFTMEGKKINKSYQPVKKGNVVIGIGPISKLSKDHHFDPNLNVINKGYGVEIVLEVDDIKEIYEQVKSSGYPIHGPLTMQNWGLEDFRLVDPDGYYLRITSKQ
ncbi:VOC family protein [Muricauda sp. NFXS6]|uniref:VOC family protein n=1 Tax=Allomuricauda sp. NFXS6 TaxID=2819094 RepID=UPI0032DFFC44